MSTLYYTYAKLAHQSSQIMSTKKYCFYYQQNYTETNYINPADIEQMPSQHNAY
jgi:hypothetical protein